METAPSSIFHSLSLARKHCLGSLELFPDLPVVKRDILIKWRKHIKKIDEVPFHPHLHFMTIGLPTGKFSYFFDLTDVLSYIIAQDIKPITLPIDIMKSHVKHVIVTDEELSNEPVIMLESPLVPKGILISGHQEVLLSQQRREKVLEVYSLSENEFITLMNDRLSQSMYMFHSDLHTLISTPGMPKKEKLYWYTATELVNCL